MPIAFRSRHNRAAHQRRLYVVAIDHHVDVPLLQQEFRCLELLRQFLADRLFDDAPSGKTDHRFRLGNDDIGLKRKRCRNAARRRIGQHRDEEIALFH